MKIKDLLKQFESFDGEMEVQFTSVIECHRSTSICENADVRISVEGNKVCVSVGGEETDSD